jgi:hypothetical protein
MVKCKEKLSRSQIETLGSKELVDKYLRFKENIDVNMNPNLRWCPRPNCTNFVEKGKHRKVKCKCS